MTDKHTDREAVGPRLDRGVGRLAPERADAAETYLNAARRRYASGTGCTYPLLPCDYCKAFVAGWHGDTARDTDSDITDAKRRGARARKRFDRTKTPNAEVSGAPR